MRTRRAHHPQTTSKWCPPIRCSITSITLLRERRSWLWSRLLCTFPPLHVRLATLRTNRRMRRSASSLMMRTMPSLTGHRLNSFLASHSRLRPSVYRPFTRTVHWRSLPQSEHDHFPPLLISLQLKFDQITKLNLTNFTTLISYYQLQHHQKHSLALRLL